MEEETARGLLADLCSRSGQRVWSASWGVVRTEDADVLGPLSAQLERIERRTEDLLLGGALASNDEVLEMALAKLRAYRDGPCRCAPYARYSRFDPSELAQRGAVRILSTSKPDYEMTYACRCEHCGQAFHVEQWESHLPWWKWIPVESAEPD